MLFNVLPPTVARMKQQFTVNFASSHFCHRIPNVARMYAELCVCVAVNESIAIPIRKDNLLAAENPISANSHKHTHSRTITISNGPNIIKALVISCVAISVSFLCAQYDFI